MEDAGIVHRDLNSHNILLLESDEFVVVDLETDRDASREELKSGT